MRKFALSLLAALALTGCSWFAEDADPALWAVKDDDTIIYLFGTVHVLKPGMHWFDKGIEEAFDAADELVLEILPVDPETMAALVKELGTRGGPPFDAHVQAAAASVGMPKGAIDRMEPWLAAATLARAAVRKAGYESSEGVETRLAREAASKGAPVHALETAREQLLLFDGLSGAAQTAMLDRTIGELPETRAHLARFIEAWGAGDAETVGAEMNRALDAAPEVADALLTRRNRRWADWVARRMQRPGTVFVAVGAGHLAGKGSVQSLLTERGLTVERVAY